VNSKSLFLGLDHIGIKAYDVEKSIKFYREVLGFEFLQRIKPGDVELVFLKLGDMVVELVEVNDDRKYSDGVVNHLSIKVSDIFAAVEHLREQQVEFIFQEPMSVGEGRYNFFFRGPAQEKLELFQA
jgi:catechol 2,3-dioxygenase-like lactoylglutathione lyase family enzyme